MTAWGIFFELVLAIGLTILILLLQERYIERFFLSEKEFDETYCMIDSDEYITPFGCRIRIASIISAISFIIMFFIWIFSYPYQRVWIFLSPIGLGIIDIFFGIVLKSLFFNREVHLVRKYNRCQKKQEYLEEIIESLKNNFSGQKNTQSCIKMLEDCCEEINVIQMYICTFFGTKEVSEYHITAQLYQQVIEDMKNTNEKMKKITKEMKKVIKDYS